MGRLSNTVGLRLGYSLPWKDNSSKLDVRDLSVKDFVKDLCIYGVGESQVKRGMTDVWFLPDNVHLIHKGRLTVIQISLYDPTPPSEISEFVKESKLLILEKYMVEELGCLYKKPITVLFDFVSGESVSASLLSRYVSIRLEQRVSLGEIVTSLRRLILTLPGVVGYRLDFSGRFTRRQRASFRSIKVGQIPFSTLSASLDYSESSSVLKYGKCGIKIWLNKVKS